MISDSDDKVCIFPLPQVALFPHAVLPLHVFEESARLLHRRARPQIEVVPVLKQVLAEDGCGTARGDDFDLLSWRANEKGSLRVAEEARSEDRTDDRAFL